MIISFSLVFSQRNCEEHERQRDSTSLPWKSCGHILQENAVMTKPKHAVLIIMSLLVLHLAHIFVYSSRSVVFLGYNNAYECLSSYLN